MSQHPRHSPTAFARFLCALAILLGFQGCNEDDDSPINQPPPSSQPTYRFFPLDASVKPYVFESGSYWIYTNTADSTMDTLVETAIRKDNYFNYWHSYTSEYEMYVMDFNSTVLGDAQEAALMSRLSRGGPYSDAILLPAEAVGGSFQQASVIGIHPSVVVSGQIFTNVIQMQVGADQFITQPLRLWYCPGTGMVRRQEVRADTVFATWDLVDWQVTPYF